MSARQSPRRRTVGWHDWLRTETPWSRLQAQLGAVYRMAVGIAHSLPALLGAAMALALIAVALLAPLLVSQELDGQDLVVRLQPPSARSWFGTDEFGRDVFSIILIGARTTLAIVAAIVGFAAVLGLLIGCCAGFVGGWLDAVLTRLTDAFLAVPRRLVAMALAVALGPGVGSMLLAVTLAAWPSYARAARDEAAALRDTDLINAARLQGASRFRILTVQIAPLCVASALIRATRDVSEIILVVAGFGFLGLGAQPPLAEWGAIIFSARRFVFEAWWLTAYPGLAIFLAALAFNLLGDGLCALRQPGRS